MGEIDLWAFQHECPAIYTISEGPFGPTKIGVTKNDRNRFRALQTGNPRPLQSGVMLICPYAYNLEQLIHERLAAAHLTGEWYNITPEMADHVLTEVMALGCDHRARQAVAASNTPVQVAEPRRKSRGRTACANRATGATEGTSEPSKARVRPKRLPARLHARLAGAEEGGERRRA
jgi:hypothetical protein